MKNKILFIATFILGTIIVTSCTNDSTSDLIDIDPIEEVTYTENIKSIIDNNCISCHAAVPVNFAPMPLVTYAQVKEAMQNRGLLDRISRAQGAEGMMPYGGTRLPQPTINLVAQWSTDGFQE